MPPTTEDSAVWAVADAGAAVWAHHTRTGTNAPTRRRTDIAAAMAAVAWRRVAGHHTTGPAHTTGTAVAMLALNTALPAPLLGGPNAAALVPAARAALAAATALHGADCMADTH